MFLHNLHLIHTKTSSLQSHMGSIKFLLLGDFNLPDINWHSLSSFSSIGSLTCDHLFDLNLIQIIIDSTHTHVGVLDLIITNQPKAVSNITIDSSSPSVSDHCMNLLDITIDEIILTRKPRWIFSYSRGDFLGSLEYLFEVNYCPAALDVYS